MCREGGHDGARTDPRNAGFIRRRTCRNLATTHERLLQEFRVRDPDRAEREARAQIRDL